MSAEREYHRITEERLSHFGRILQQQEYSRGTVENYMRSVKAFRAWHHGGFDKRQVLSWKAQLVSCCAPATVNTMLAGINCFFRAQGWEDCVVKPLRLQRRSFSAPERELDKSEYFRLVRAARAAGKERLALVMETICATGLRVSEVPYITLEAAVDGKAKELLIELAEISLEIAQMAITPEDGTDLPNWFVVEAAKDIPNLLKKRK